VRRVCCSLLQYVAVCCSVLQCVAVCCSVLQCVAVCCSVLQCEMYETWEIWDECVAVCCSVLQCVAVRDVRDVKDMRRVRYTCMWSVRVYLISHLSHTLSYDLSWEIRVRVWLIHSHLHLSHRLSYTLISMYLIDSHIAFRCSDIDIRDAWDSDIWDQSHHIDCCFTPYLLCRCLTSHTISVAVSHSSPMSQSGMPQKRLWHQRDSDIWDESVCCSTIPCRCLSPMSLSHASPMSDSLLRDVWDYIDETRETWVLHRWDGWEMSTRVR